MKSPVSTEVLFIWDVPNRLRNYLRGGLADVPSINLIFPDSSKESDFINYASTADAIVGWRPSSNLLQEARNLKLFINPGAGVQHLVSLFREVNTDRNVVLVNGHGNTFFTAQHALALLLCLLNKIIPHHNWMTEGRWRTGDSEGATTPLRWINVGLLGYGAVNTKVHRLLSPFDVTFSVLKRRWKGAELLPTEITRYEPHQLHEFLEAIDILIVAVPQTDETLGLIGERELSLLGPDGYIVNISRGPVVVEKDLYTALLEKKIKGAAIDVWNDYKPEPDEAGKRFPFHYPFNELDNIVLSPHRGASPMDDLHRWDEVIENLRILAEGRRDFINIVDLELAY